MKNVLVTITILFAAIVCRIPVSAQEGVAIIDGTVRDSETGNPLPAAQVRIQGLRSGTITNVDGEFQLEIPSFPAEIIISFIGYESAELTVAAADTVKTFDILLEPRMYVLPTVVVTSGNTAETIMRRVIARKKEWSATLETYRTDAYTRVHLANDEKIAFISESISEFFWHKNKGTKEFATFRKNTENMPESEAVVSARMVPNFYDDNIDLFGFNMVGLTHPDALDYYSFEIIEHSMLDNKTVYIMSVEPKSKLQPLFRGTVSVLDEDYAMIDLDVRPNEAVIYPAPLNDFTFTVKQQFSNFGADVWLPVDVRVSGHIKIKFGVLLEMPVINYSQVSHFSDYNINVALPDSLFDTEQVGNLTVDVSNEEIAVSVSTEDRPRETEHVQNESVSEYPANEFRDKNNRESVAQVDSAVAQTFSAADSIALKASENARRDSLFVLNRTAIPLTTEEEKAYAEIDSSMTMEKMFEPSGLIVTIAEGIESDEDKGAHETEKELKEKTLFGKAVGRVTKDMSPSFWHNRVDRHHIGAKWRKRYKNRMRYSFGVAYKTAFKRWSWNAGTEVFLLPNQRTSVFLSGFSGTETRQRIQYYPLWLNTVMTLGGYGDYFDYYHSEKYLTGIRLRFRNKTLETTLNIERHEPVGSSSFFDIMGKLRTFRANPAVKTGDLRSLSMRFTYGRDIGPFALDGSKGIILAVEHATPAFLGGSQTFTRFEADVVWRFETYLKRRLFPMTLDIRFTGSASAGTLPIERFSSLDSRFMFWTPFGSFRSLGTLPLEGEHHTALFVEHNFRTVPFEIIGLRAVAKKNIGIILHGGAGRTWIGSERLKSLGYKPHYVDKIVSEAGISLNNLFGFMRLDYTKRLDRPDSTVGVSIARIM